MRYLDSCISGVGTKHFFHLFLPRSYFFFALLELIKTQLLMIPFRLLLILHGFVLSMLYQACQELPVFLCYPSIVLRKRVVSTRVNLKADSRGGPGSRMTRIHVHSSNSSNPDSPPFPSQLFVLLWEPWAGPYLKLI